MTALEFMKDFYSTNRPPATVSELMEAYAEHKNSEMAGNLLERTAQLKHCQLAVEVLAKSLAERVLFPTEPRLQPKGVSHSPGTITESRGPAEDPGICQDPKCPNRMYHPAREHTATPNPPQFGTSRGWWVFKDGRWTIES